MSEFLLFVSNSVNFYEFIGFVTFYIAEHELILVYNSFLLDLILVSMVPCATVRTLKPKNLKPKNPKKPKNLKTFLKNLRFLPALVLRRLCLAHPIKYLEVPTTYYIRQHLNCV